MQIDDQITEVNGEKIYSLDELDDTMRRSLRDNGRVLLTVQRKDGSTSYLGIRR
jgi:PDZ domain-containing secreted protein